MKRLVVLISGKGSNLRAIVEASAREKWPAKVVAVISNRKDAAGLDFAAQQGIPTAVLDHQDFPSRELFDAALMTLIDGYTPDLVVLAGFMRVLTASFVDYYAGRLINIHPSLLPAFPGLKTHQRALAAGVKIHGCTVHWVTAEVDHGPILAQAVVPVLPGDDEEALAARVQSAEHQIYPCTIRSLVTQSLEASSNAQDDSVSPALTASALTTPTGYPWLFV